MSAAAQTPGGCRDVALSAVCRRALTLTALALGTMRATSVRQRVKCVDRLLANAHLESERLNAYRALAHEWLSGLPQLLKPTGRQRKYPSGKVRNNSSTRKIAIELRLQSVALGFPSRLKRARTLQ